MGKLEKIPAWHLTKVRNKNEVIAEARNEGISMLRCLSLSRVFWASLSLSCSLLGTVFSEPLSSYDSASFALCAVGGARSQKDSACSCW